MSLKQNGRLMHQMPLRHLGTVGFEYQDTNKSQNRNIFAGQGGIDARSGLPNGQTGPSSWVLPQKDGGIASYTGITGDGSLASGGAMGINSGATITGNLGTLSALGDLVAYIASSLSGNGTLNGNVFAALNFAATLSGNGDANGALEALGYILANLQGDGSLTLTPSAIAVVEATIQPFTELSPKSLSDAVWSYLAINPTMAGSMKEELEKIRANTNLVPALL